MTSAIATEVQSSGDEHDADEADAELERARCEQRQDANMMLGSGLGLGALGATTAVLFGSVCPVCVVAAPALLAVGVVKRVRARRRAADPSKDRG